jgi:hypothetical protein
LDTEPLSTPPTNLAMKMAMLTPIATTTVVRLSDATHE